MPSRPIQHQLEDLSRSKFKITLPCEWVFRDKHNDYGIDGEVEIFDKDGKSTGLLFFVQLKATQSTNKKLVKTVKFNIDTLHYYRSLPAPVLIVRYDATNDCFLTMWAHEIDLFYAIKAQKSISVRFKEGSEWEVQDKQNIVSFLEKYRALAKQTLPIPIPTIVTIDKKSTFIINNYTLKDDIINKLAAHNDIIKTTHDQHEALIDISISAEEVIVRVLGDPRCTFQYTPPEDKILLVEEITDLILIGIAGAIAQREMNDLAAKIIFSGNISEKVSRHLNILQLFLPHLLRSSYYDNALKLISSILQDDKSCILEFITHICILISLNRTNERQASAIESFLFNCAETSESIDKQKYGINLYNIGNFYRSRHLPRKAIKFYLRARKFQPAYYKQGYFFAELGGLFFHINKFKISASFYKKALEIESKKDWVPLYADALMFCGNYQESLDTLDPYINSEKNCADEWVLKNFFLDNIVNNFKVKSQDRNEILANKLADISLSEKDELRKNLESSLESDFLCALAWYNIAQNHYREADIYSAAVSFIFSSLLSRTDVEGWVNAVSCLLNIKKHDGLIIHTIKTAYTINRESFRSSLYSRLEESGVDSSSIIDVLETIIATCPTDKEDAELRIPDEAGKMNDILSLIKK